jgi:hypothetical protein
MNIQTLISMLEKTLSRLNAQKEKYIEEGRIEELESVENEIAETQEVLDRLNV